MTLPFPIDPLSEAWDPGRKLGEMPKGFRCLVVGIANEHSIAHGCAAKLRAFGDDLHGGLHHVA